MSVVRRSSGRSLWWIIVLLTLLSVAPALLILMTSFTRIAVVLSLTRNALGLQSIPPNQVIVGLALFLSLFVMRPTFEQLDGRTRLVLHEVYPAVEARDAAIASGMEHGIKEGYERLDELLAA